ncbi:MAG: JAB domain-containing protein [Bacteroides sp.]|uniref:JAB domain-containing protein n=1 Tax=Bacteroides sp. TaxID=29523 RepID=UPI00283D93B0|nr:JAB domain-containing protein [Bacteroides sp.]MDR3823049.1 JAB domain-containing protein [Bacteroides sp.]
MNTLFDNDCRYMSDSELIYEISNNRQIVSDIERSNEVIDLEKLFSSLTPGRRRVAVAAVEIYKRQQSQQVERRQIFRSADIYELMGPLIGDLPNEEFWVISLNQSAKLIKKVRISVGGITQTSADIRLIMRVLIDTRATQFAAVHNHPSGNIRPSNEDKKLTEQLKKAAVLFNITMIDHVIITNGGYYSFGDEGLI